MLAIVAGDVLATVAGESGVELGGVGDRKGDVETASPGVDKFGEMTV